MLALAQFQPEIAQNTGTLLRLSSCLGITLHLIGPYGFTLTDRNLKRAGLDYLDRAHYDTHLDETAFLDYVAGGRARCVLLEASKSGTEDYYNFSFGPRDILILGRESDGFKRAAQLSSAAKVHIPMCMHNRSLNVAVAGAMVLSEAMRQLGSVDVKII